MIQANNTVIRAAPLIASYTRFLHPHAVNLDNRHAKSLRTIIRRLSSCLVSSSKMPTSHDARPLPIISHNIEQKKPQSRIYIQRNNEITPMRLKQISRTLPLPLSPISSGHFSHFDRSRFVFLSLYINIPQADICPIDRHRFSTGQGKYPLAPVFNSWLLPFVVAGPVALFSDQTVSTFQRRVPPRKSLSWRCLSVTCLNRRALRSSSNPAASSAASGLLLRSIFGHFVWSASQW